MGGEQEAWILRTCVEDELRGNREVLVVPVSMRKRMMALVHDSLGHVGDGKMRWPLQQVRVVVGRA